MSTPQKTPSDVAWLQNGVDVYQIDLSQPAETLPANIDRYLSYAFDTQWSGSPTGQMILYVTQASAQHGQIVAGMVPIFWVPVDNVTLQIRTASDPNVQFPATSPSAQGQAPNQHNWAKLVWTPNSGSTGSLTALFGGVLKT